MTDARQAIERLRELLEKATPGPWSVHWPQVLSEPYWGVEPLLLAYTHEGYEAEADANPELIVALVNAAPALLEVAERAIRVDRTCVHPALGLSLVKLAEAVAEAVKE